MESNNLALSTLIILALVVVAYTSIHYFLGVEFDEREPPVLNSTIPYIGHILGLIRHGQYYLERLGHSKRLPIYTIQMLNKKTYVVNSPDLILAVERASKTITLYPFIAMLSPRLFDADKRCMAIINENLNLENGPWGLCHDISHAMHAKMAPGADLDLMNKTMLSKYLPQLNQVEECGIRVNLFEWIRKTFAKSSTEAIYGPGNPFAKQPDLEADFWSFDEGFSPLIFGMPTPMARKAHKSRARIIQAMVEYFERGEHERGMPVIQARYSVGRRYGSRIEDMARYEIGDVIGILINAVPTFFWSILHIYSNEELLLHLREEVEAATETIMTADGRTVKHRMNITDLQEACPLLLSTFREVLRYHTHNSTNRWVTEDTMIANKYLFKKDSIVQMPAGVVHTDESLWGSDCNKFDAHRFLKQQDLKASGKAGRLHPGAYRAWGGGQTLCPGRFFATTEITCSLAMLVSRFDIQPVGKKWKMPTVSGNRMAHSVHPPDNDVEVQITTRVQGHEWEYVFEKDSEASDM